MNDPSPEWFHGGFGFRHCYGLERLIFEREKKNLGWKREKDDILGGINCGIIEVGRVGGGKERGSCRQTKV